MTPIVAANNPNHWETRPSPVELALDTYIGSMTPNEFDALVARTRGARR